MQDEPERRLQIPTNKTYLVLLIVHPVFSERSTSYCLPGILGVCRTSQRVWLAVARPLRLTDFKLYLLTLLPRDCCETWMRTSVSSRCNRTFLRLCASTGGWLRGRLCVFYLLHSRFSKGPPSSATQAIMRPDIAIMSESQCEHGRRFRLCSEVVGAAAARRPRASRRL